MQADLRDALEMLDDSEEALLTFYSELDLDATNKILSHSMTGLKGWSIINGFEQIEKISHELLKFLRLPNSYTQFKEQQHFLANSLVTIRQLLNGETENSQCTNLSVLPFLGPEIKIKKRAIILVVEDEDDLRELMARNLSAKGFEVVDFPNPVAALAYLEKNHPDVVVTDLEMPEMGGMEFIAELRKKYALLPVIIASAFVTKDICAEVLRCGACGILEKPFQAGQLVSMVELNFDRYRSYKLLTKSLKHLQYQQPESDECFGKKQAPEEGKDCN
jgi:CheY-like chemotaxis protein